MNAATPYPLLASIASPDDLRKLPASELDGVAQARLQGDRAQAIVAEGTWSTETLTAALVEKNVIVRSIEPVEPTLEDVFTLLAHQRPAAD